MSRTKILIGLLLLLPLRMVAQDVMEGGVVYHHQEVENREDYRKGNACQKDFLLAMQLLRESHPAFAEGMTPPFDIDSMTTQGYRAAGSMTDGKQLATYLQHILSKLHDGHSLISSVMYDDSAIYPVTYYRQGDNYYLWGGTEAVVTHLGRQIARINGVPVAEVMAAFRGDISYENDTDCEERLHDRVFRNAAYWTDKPFWRADSAMVLTFKDGMTVAVKPEPGWTELHMAKWRRGRSPQVTVRQPTTEAFTASVDMDKGIAYLQLNTCFDPYTTLLIMKMRGMEVSEELVNRLREKPNFHEFLQEFFAELSKVEVNTLVVDLRDNSGGCSLISYELLSWLYPIQQLKCVTEAIRYSPLYEQYYKTEAEQEIKAVKEANQGAFSYRKLYDADTDKEFSRSEMPPVGFAEAESAPEIYNFNKRKIFKGDIIFLQNERTFSAAADIILMARDNGIGKIVGSRGCYQTSNYSSALTWQLPNTGISGMVSHRACFRPDRSRLSERELMPDVLIEYSWDDVLQGRDKCWEWVIGERK